MLNLIKASMLGENINFELDVHILDAKTDPFGADLFVYLRHIRIQIIEKITGKTVNCV